jgi:hypothetical protein
VRSHHRGSVEDELGLNQRVLGCAKRLSVPKRLRTQWLYGSNVCEGQVAGIDHRIFGNEARIFRLVLLYVDGGSTGDDGEVIGWDVLGFFQGADESAI